MAEGSRLKFLEEQVQNLQTQMEEMKVTEGDVPRWWVEEKKGIEAKMAENQNYIIKMLDILIKKKYGQDATIVGNEGGVAPNIRENNDGLQKILGDAFKDLYKSFVTESPIMSIEGPSNQDDWEHYSKLTKEIGEKVQIVGDDLLVTNPERVGKAINEKTRNALLFKVNQIGSVTESIEVVKMPKRAEWGMIANHCSGETENTFIATLSLGLDTGQIKTGAPCRSSTFRSAATLIFFAGDDFSHFPTTDANSGKLVMFSGELDFSTGAHALLNKNYELRRVGFGAVYRTVLRDGRSVAIKKVTVSSLVKSQKIFKACSEKFHQKFSILLFGSKFHKKLGNAMLIVGSGAVKKYLPQSGLQKYLNQQGFNIVGYGCTTCIRNSGELGESVASAISVNDLLAAENSSKKIHIVFQFLFSLFDPWGQGSTEGRGNVMIMKEVLDNHANQKGSIVLFKKLRIGFSHDPNRDGAINSDHLRNVESMVNQQREAELGVYSKETMLGSVFYNFDSKLTVININGEEPHKGIIVSIRNDNPAIVSCVDDERLEFQDGNLIMFSKVQGMTELNDGKPWKIKSARPYSFTLEENTTNFGIVIQILVNFKVLNFKPLREALKDPDDFLLSDFSKLNHPPSLHIAFQALDKFIFEIGRFHVSGSEEDAKKLTYVAAAFINPQHKIEALQVQFRK